MYTLMSAEDGAANVHDIDSQYTDQYLFFDEMHRRGCILCKVRPCTYIGDICLKDDVCESPCELCKGA